MQAKFNLKALKPLFEEVNKATKFMVNYEDLYNPELYPNNVIVDNQGRTEADPNFSFPDQDKLDKSKLCASFWLVKDQGLYIMHNGVCETDDKVNRTVVYAEGCDPDNDPDWYENARSIFGGDDGCNAIPLDWYIKALNPNRRKFIIDIKSNSMSLRL